MQHVKPKWLHIVAYVTLIVDVAMFFGYFYFQYANVSQATIDFWGITPLVLFLAGTQIFVTLSLYPFVRRMSEWAGFVMTMIPYGLMLSAVIETSGNVNLVYRFLFILLVFTLNMVGPYLSIASAVVAWILLIFDFLSLGHPVPEARDLNIIADVLVSIAAVGGWFFFKRYYIRDQQTAKLTSMLEQEQFKASVILESITDGVIVVNTEGNTQIINQSAATMLGWGKEEARNLPYSSLFSIIGQEGPLTNETRNTSSQDAIGQVLITGKPKQMTSQIKTRTRQLFIDTVASPIYQESQDKNGNLSKHLVGVIAVLRDVDEQKKQEQQRTEFISTASHEMRTPVAAIEGYLALAMNDKVCLIDEKARSYLDKAHASTQHLGQLFQDLLTSAKADDGRLASHPEVVELGAFLEHLIEDLRFAAEKKGLALEYVIGTDQDHINTSTQTTQLVKPLYYVTVDPDRIREVVTNLFDNAVKYTPSGKITIGLTGNNEVVQFYIKDTGSGIPPEDVPHLFQKFYRVDNSATRTIGGTGLGLFICRKVVELYHGRIWVKSKLGGGSTFYINLPRLEASKVESERQRLAAWEAQNAKSKLPPSSTATPKGMVQ